MILACMISAIVAYVIGAIVEHFIQRRRVKELEHEVEQLRYEKDIYKEFDEGRAKSMQGMLFENLKLKQQIASLKYEQNLHNGKIKEDEQHD